MIPSVFFVSGETGRRRTSGEKFSDLVRNGAGHIGVNANQFRRRLLAALLCSTSLSHKVLLLHGLNQGA
jgi:hypothetical protein